jgi:hypothetical protein
MICRKSETAYPSRIQYNRNVETQELISHFAEKISELSVKENWNRNHTRVSAPLSQPQVETATIIEGSLLVISCMSA